MSLLFHYLQQSGGVIPLVSGPPLAGAALEEEEDTVRALDFSSYLAVIAPPPPPPEPVETSSEPLSDTVERMVVDEEEEGMSFYESEEEVGEGPMGHWPFDTDGTSTVGVYPAAMINSPKILTTGGIIGGALELNGTSQYVDLGNAVGLIGVPRSYAMWLHPYTVSGQRGIFSKISNHPADNGNGLLIEQSSSTLSVYINALTPQVFRANFFASGVWVFCAVVVEGTTISVFKDGDLEGFGSFGGTVTDFPQGGVLIGKQNNLNRYFHGRIDDLRVYPRALSEQEVSDLYLEGAP